eukprot:scaffold1368_cov72-Skeletonema_marinoi.AAC.2
MHSSSKLALGKVVVAAGRVKRKSAGSSVFAITSDRWWDLFVCFPAFALLSLHLHRAFASYFDYCGRSDK